NEAAAFGTALNGNLGKVSLYPGTGGIQPILYPGGTALTTNGFGTASVTLNPSLSFAPTLGTQFTIINNTAMPVITNPIVGRFANLPQNGSITVNYLGTLYGFSGNYFGGSGSNLVLTYAPVTTTTLGSTSATSVYGQTVVFAATVASAVAA